MADPTTRGVYQQPPQIVPDTNSADIYAQARARNALEAYKTLKRQQFLQGAKVDTTDTTYAQQQARQLARKLTGG